MDRDGIVDLLQQTLGGRADLVAVYLFGSVARGEAHADSDIDVGVLLAAGAPHDLPSYEPIADLQADLEERLGRPVDVVAMDGAPVDVVHRILRDGIVVHESDHRRRMLFELKARNEWFDLQPILEYYRRTVIGGA